MAKTDPSEPLMDLADRLDALHKKHFSAKVQKTLKQLGEGIERAAIAFCGSWLGYHANVYYQNLQSPPPGAIFSVEWGLTDRHFNDTIGEWMIFAPTDLISAIRNQCKAMPYDELTEAANAFAADLDPMREELLSTLTALTESSADAYLKRLFERATKLHYVQPQEVINRLQPRQAMSRDSQAIHAGMQVPPHISVLAQVEAIESRFSLAKNLCNIARQAGGHLARRDSAKRLLHQTGTKVFIGHGRSSVWRDLKDFIQDRLSLEWDEFNRVPVAGITNIARLSTMLDDAGIAFLVMTAEDELKDGKMQARMNVVHEAGMFQGRLGFTKAIVLLEEGCEEFSNIQGLGQIRFPPGQISAAFEEIRRVLEREELLPSQE